MFRIRLRGPVIVIAALLALIACGGGGTTGTPASPTPTTTSAVPTATEAPLAAAPGDRYADRDGRTNDSPAQTNQNAGPAHRYPSRDARTGGDQHSGTSDRHANGIQGVWLRLSFRARCGRSDDRHRGSRTGSSLLRLRAGQRGHDLAATRQQPIHHGVGHLRSYSKQPA